MRARPTKLTSHPAASKRPPTYPPMLPAPKTQMREVMKCEPWERHTDDVMMHRKPQEHFPMTQLKDQIVGMTGASGGSGEALARRAAARGAKLILSARREAELERVRLSLPRPQDVAVLPVDLTRVDDPAALAAQAAAFFG